MQWDCDILILFKICKAICKMMYYVKGTPKHWFGKIRKKANSRPKTKKGLGWHWLKKMKTAFSLNKIFMLFFFFNFFFSCLVNTMILFLVACYPVLSCSHTHTISPQERHHHKNRWQNKVKVSWKSPIIWQLFNAVKFFFPCFIFCVILWVKVIISVRCGTSG